MARLSMFMLFDSMSQQGPQGCQLSNPLLAIQPQVIPSSFSFVIAFGISGIDPRKEHTLSLTILDPQGSEIRLMYNQKLMPMEDEKKETSLPENYRGIAMNFDIRNFLFREEGCYRIVIIIDGEAFEHDLPVFKRAGVN